MVYEQIGQAKGPNVVFKAITAFLLPIAVFIGTLTAMENMLARAIRSRNLRIAAGFAAAATVAFICALVTSAVNRRLTKKMYLRRR